jgi:predicted nucleotidyltransferase
MTESDLSRESIVNKSEVMKKLASFEDELKKFFVKDLYLFGSYAREEAGEQSDLDILVEFEPGAQIGLFEFARLRRQLSELLGREVDLVTPDAIRPEMKDQILREAVHAS